MTFLTTLFDTVISLISLFIFDVLFKSKLSTLITFILLVVAGYFLFFSSDVAPAETATETTLPVVTLARVADTNGGTTFTAVGTLQAVSEAKLQTETGGRIVGVYTTLGATVRAGSIIARLEGDAESAQLLQAQGAYEAALAGSAQSGVGISEAENGVTASKNAALTTYKNAYTTVSGIVFTSIDKHFANPNAQVPGVRLFSSDYTSYLNSERVALQTILPAWQKGTTELTVSGNLDAALSTAAVTTKRIIAMTDAYIDILNNEDPSVTYSADDLRGLIASFSVVRTQLSGTLSAIDGARTGLSAAQDGLARAQIAASGNGPRVSSADAQIKIALGSLRAAQANYERTLVRTPITGVVNALYVKTGEYAAPSTPAAIIANNNQGLEVSTSVSQEESALLAIGDEVRIDKVATGTIAAIGGAIDPTTGKVALKISVVENSSLQNGSTVSLSFTAEKNTDMTEIVIPLSAIKMTGSGPVVFTVDPEKKVLVENPVVLGNIRGELVVILNGITRDTEIVVDGRGLKGGSAVIIATK